MLKVYTGFGRRREPAAEKKLAVCGAARRDARRSSLLRFTACRDVIEKVADNGAICMRFE